MKSILFTILFLFVSKLCVAQLSANDKKIFLDSTWNETSQENSKYYRIVKDYYLEKDLYIVNDYYKSGVLQMEGFSKTKDHNTKEGEFIFYFESGNKKAVTYFVKSRPSGSCAEWYENGSKKLEGEYIEDEKSFMNVLRVDEFWNSKGIQTVVDGTGDYEESLEFFYASGKVKEGFKDGLWEGYDKMMSYTFSENYGDKKFISGVSVDKDGVSYNYNAVETRPAPKKGFEDFYRHVGKKFQVPNMPKGVGGKIFVKFIVDKEGRIVEPEIIKGIGYGADEEALRVVSSYANFAPGEIRGIKVRCTFSLPIAIQPM
ncbi:energy transducer TonB [Flavobacterium sp.]|jgi:antitoxin component YwqK of YwqJK toxin-antitoxin module|uniref:energy transducer TonB n=1 Tax=Flavobacterium sp. TaxID=239 RepID=UPI0037C18856